MKSSKLMAKRGFHGTSMRDLAQETGRSLSGLYHYFRSKEDLLFLINLYGFTTLNDTWRRLADTLERPREKLYAFVFFHVTYFVEHMDEMRVMTWGTQTLNLEKARTIQKLKDRYTNVATRIVREVCEAEDGGEVDDKRTSRGTNLLFGMMNWIFSGYSPRRHGSVGELINDIYRTFLSGISGSKHDEEDLARLQAIVSSLYGQNKKRSMWASSEGAAG